MTDTVDVLGLAMTRADFDDAVKTVYSGDFKHLTDRIGDRAHEIRRIHEADLLASGFTLSDLPPPDPHLRRACTRVKIKEVAPEVFMAGPVRIPNRYLEESLAHNQMAHSCCRHPENHSISAWYTSAVDEAKGVPDVYIFHCDCGRVHRRAMLGGSKNAYGEVTAPRQKWEIR